MPKQRTAVPEPLRAVVQKIVLERGAHRRRGAFGPQRQRLAVIVEAVHFLFDDVGRFAYAAHKKLGSFDDRRADVAVAVGTARDEPALLHATR